MGLVIMFQDWTSYQHLVCQSDAVSLFSQEYIALGALQLVVTYGSDLGSIPAQAAVCNRRDWPVCLRV